MKRAYIYKLISVIFTALLFSVNLLYSQSIVQSGKIDLKTYNFDQNGPVELNGQWEFYPAKLYTEKDFESGNTVKPIIVDVPSLWDNKFFINTEKPNIGYGTYRLKITVPDNIEILALRLKRIETAYKIFADDSLVLSVGNVGSSKEKSQAGQKTLAKIFPVKESFSLIIQVSNFHHRKGGIHSEIVLGLPKQIIKKNRIAGSYEISIIGVLLIMAVFHIGLFFFGKKDYSLLFFSILLISEIFSIMTNGEVLFTYIFPDMSWIVLKRIDYISNFFRVTFFALFFYQLYSKEINKIFILVLAGLNSIMTLLVLFTELSFFSFTLFVFIAIAVISFIYVIYAQIKSLMLKTEGALIPFTGMLILILTAINDILFVSNIIQTIYLTPFGLFIFIFSQSYILSFNFSNLYKKAEEMNKLTSDLDEIKSRLLNDRSINLNNTIEILNEKAEATKGYIFSVINIEAKLKGFFPSNNDNKLNGTYLDAIINKVIAEKESIIINNTDTSPYKELLNSTDSDLKSLVCIPLIIADKCRSVLYFENADRKSAFNSNIVELFKNLSDQIVGLTENYILFTELEDLKHNLEAIVYKRTKDIRNQRDMLTEQKDEILTINNEISYALEEVSKKNKIITDNVNIAKITQNANLPDEQLVNSLFPEVFILFRPKEILSGDFYWANKINIGENKVKSLFSVADCTGHGVPGALMSLIGNYLLNNAVFNEKISKPSEILDNIQKNIKAKLSSEEDKDVEDGMDIAIISYDKEENILEYAGAKIDLILIRENEITEIKSDKKSIGIGRLGKQIGDKFINHKLTIQKGDLIYIYSDGFQDQFGGENDRRFMKKNLKLLLEDISKLSFNIQRSHLLKTLNRWQGKNIQNDDILVVGISF
ncbi:MAG: SpoIIE family protein phosphatase [Bacteroidales bacterium]|nr:SpoIIE family protein phosphatase [Bacteroidales bacterium]